MSVLTKEDLQKLNPGDVVFHVNPYDVGEGAEQYLDYHEIKVVSNDGEVIKHGDRDWDKEHISDMIRGVKKTFSNRGAAAAMVDHIKKFGNFPEVKEHHDSCKDFSLSWH